LIIKARVSISVARRILLVLKCPFMSAIAELTRQIDPMRPLTAAEGEDGELYVDWQKSLGGDDVKLRLSREIARRAGQAAVHLLTGLQGTGKTTELYRVKNLLEAGVDGRNFFVSMLAAEKSLELADVKAELLSYQIISQLVTDLQNAGFHVSGPVLTFFKDLRSEFRKLRIDAIELGSGIVKFTLRVQDVTGDRREEYQRLLQGNLPKIHDMANDHLLVEARSWLARCKNIDDILIVVDELDRMPRSADRERLFIDGASWLRALGCHMLYTVPLDLYYSRQHTRLLDIYGTDPMILPVMPVHDREGREHPKALQALGEIVLRRGRAAGLDIGDIFEEEELLRKLLMVSGGHVRTLLRMIRSILNRCDNLPIPRIRADESIHREAADMKRALSDEDWQILTKVHRTKEPVNGPESDQWNELIRGQYVLAYYEDGSGYWYDWNPLLEYAPAGTP
jgi:hypothetical protein